YHELIFCAPASVLFASRGLHLSRSPAGGIWRSNSRLSLAAATKSSETLDRRRGQAIRCGFWSFSARAELLTAWLVGLGANSPPCSKKMQIGRSRRALTP